VVLGCDVALAGGQIQCRDVVSPVSVLKLDCSGTGCESEKLMAETDTHDWDLGRLHEAGEMVDGFLAMGWVTGPVGDEDTVEVVGHLVNREVVREDCNACSTADQAAKNVLLDTAVDDCDVHISIRGTDVEWGLGAHFLDQVDLLRVNEGFVLVCIIFLSNGDSSQRRSNFPQMGDNSTSIDTRDGRNTLTSTPLTQALNSRPVTVLLSIIGHNNTHTLNVGTLKVFQQTVFVSSGGWNTIVADKRLGEDEDLSTVRGIGHRLGVSNKRSREDRLARNVRLGPEGLAVEDRTILKKQNQPKRSFYPVNYLIP
jgi:hypothetical protein